MAKSTAAEEKPGKKKNGGVVKGTLYTTTVMFQQLSNKSCHLARSWSGEMNSGEGPDTCSCSVWGNASKSRVCSGSCSCAPKMFLPDSARVLGLSPWDAVLPIETEEEFIGKL